MHRRVQRGNVRVVVFAIRWREPYVTSTTAIANDVDGSPGTTWRQRPHIPMRLPLHLTPHCVGTHRLKVSNTDFALFAGHRCFGEPLPTQRSSPSAPEPSTNQRACAPPSPGTQPTTPTTTNHKPASSTTITKADLVYSEPRGAIHSVGWFVIAAIRS